VTELQSEDNSVFASVDVTNGSPAEEDASPAAAGAADTGAMTNLFFAMLFFAIPVFFSCVYLIMMVQKKSKAKEKNKAGTTITVDVELQSNPMKH
jgi:heme/copper-type cytochrome/quinol oxidase subunit 2